MTACLEDKNNCRAVQGMFVQSTALCWLLQGHMKVVERGRSKSGPIIFSRNEQEDMTAPSGKWGKNGEGYKEELCFSCLHLFHLAPCFMVMYLCGATFASWLSSWNNVSWRWNIYPGPLWNSSDFSNMCLNDTTHRKLFAVSFSSNVYLPCKQKPLMPISFG